jgi:hypothetical protein
MDTTRCVYLAIIILMNCVGGTKREEDGISATSKCMHHISPRFLSTILPCGHRLSMLTALLAFPLSANPSHCPLRHSSRSTHGNATSAIHPPRSAQQRSISTPPTPPRSAQQGPTSSNRIFPVLLGSASLTNSSSSCAERDSPMLPSTCFSSVLWMKPLFSWEGRAAGSRTGHGWQGEVLLSCMVSGLCRHERQPKHHSCLLTPRLSLSCLQAGHQWLLFC